LHENLRKAEEQGFKNLDPELQKSVDELKAAAQSVHQPYKSSTVNPLEPEQDDRKQ
jgi:sec-independent protein translocase protein TatB